MLIQVSQIFLYMENFILLLDLIPNTVSNIVSVKVREFSQGINESKYTDYDWIFNL